MERSRIFSVVEEREPEKWKKARAKEEFNATLRKQGKLKVSVQNLGRKKIALETEIAELKKERDEMLKEIDYTTDALKLVKAYRNDKKRYLDKVDFTSVRTILTTLAAAVMEVDPDDMKAKNRKTEVVFARRLVYTYVEKHPELNITQTEITRVFSQDHATYIHARRKHSEDYESKIKCTRYSVPYDLFNGLMAEIYDLMMYKEF